MFWGTKWYELGVFGYKNRWGGGGTIVLAARLDDVSMPSGRPESVRQTLEFSDVQAQWGRDMNQRKMGVQAMGRGPQCEFVTSSGTVFSSREPPPPELRETTKPTRNP